MGRDCRCNCREFAKSGDNLPTSQAPQGLLGAAMSNFLYWGWSQAVDATLHLERRSDAQEAEERKSAARIQRGPEGGDVGSLEYVSSAEGELIGLSRYVPGLAKLTN